MLKNHIACFGIAILGSLFLASCSTVQEPIIEPTVQEAQKIKVSFDDIPGWRSDDFTAVWPAFMQSCHALANQQKWQGVCEKAKQVTPNDGIMIQQFFELNFDPYQVLKSDGDQNGMATGYYEPLLRGSRKRHGPYKTALYKQPNDMLEIDISSLYPQLKGLRLRGKVINHKVVPYDSRKDISTSNKLKGSEIVWVDDVIDAFFLEIQGSGRVYLPETHETIRLAYANQNGHPYRSIGKYLIDKGELKPGQASAQQIKRWVRTHPKRLNEVLNANPSVVFFKEEKLTSTANGPKGALGVPLTSARSVAVDAKFIPLGAPVFINTTEPLSDKPLQRLMMAQDTGGAIRGPIRIDYFWGFGDTAGKHAGKMKQKLNVWILSPKQ